LAKSPELARALGKTAEDYYEITSEFERDAMLLELNPD